MWIKKHYHNLILLILLLIKNSDNYRMDHKKYRRLFIDMDIFYASIEQMDNPEIKGKPVIVVPCLTDYTCAIAASYEAKALGRNRHSHR